MSAPRAAIVLEDADEPWTTVAELRRGTITVRALPPGEQVEASADDDALAKIAARMVSSQIEQFAAQEAMRRGAAGEERIRMARDLHDGLLQSLTGVSLQMQTLIRQADGPALAQRLRALQEVIANEQRELRSLVTQLRPQPGVAAEVSLDVRLRALADRIGSQWNVAVDVTVTPPSPALRGSVAAEI
jgi:signal transduction histidine kinase